MKTSFQTRHRTGPGDSNSHLAERGCVGDQPQRAARAECSGFLKVLRLVDGRHNRAPGQNENCDQSDDRLRRQGFTLVETMVAMSIFGLVVSAMMSAHIFGLRQDQLVRSKVGASDQSREAIGRLSSEIRSAKIFRVGNGSQSSFTGIPDGQIQQGTALRIYPTTSTNSYIQYYFDPQADQLRRMQSGTTGFRVVADHLTNSMFFRAEDYRGNVLTELEHNYLIGFKLEFYQYQYPQTKVGGGNYYDYYKLEFKVTRRAHD